jgi:hypothetical protein
LALLVVETGVYKLLEPQALLILVVGVVEAEQQLVRVVQAVLES